MLLADVRGSEEARTFQHRPRPDGWRGPGTSPPEVFTLAKLLWVREHEPSLFARAAFAVSAKDYIQCRLTGVVSTEPSDAGNFLLLKGIPTQWSAGLIDAIGVPLHLFPGSEAVL